MSRHALQGSIYHLWITKYGLRIGRAQQTIRAANLNTRDAFLLGVRRGAAALLVECTGSLSDGAPLWFERTLYRGDAYEFHNQHPSPGRLLSSF
jgi:GntR family transcriptional regulator